MRFSKWSLIAHIKAGNAQPHYLLYIVLLQQKSPIEVLQGVVLSDKKTLIFYWGFYRGLYPYNLKSLDLIISDFALVKVFIAVTAERVK